MRRTTAVAVLTVAALSLAACSSSSEDSSSGGDGTADTAAADALIAPYEGQPSAFPVTKPLQTSPAGKRIAYMDCGTPICGLFYQLAQAPAEALGMELTRIDTGLAADTVAGAFDTVVSAGYDGVFVPAIPAQLWESGLTALNDAGIPVVTSGVIGLDSDQVPVRQASEIQSTLSAQLLAGYVVSTQGADADVVFYRTPELQFTSVMYDAFAAEMTELCGGCSVRDAEIPAATLGTRSSSLVIDDLQAHPTTTTAVFAVGEQAAGLPTALETAGLEMTTISNSPDPATLEQIQDGDMAAGLGLDIPVLTWTLIDSLARLTTGQDVDPGAAADTPPMQVLAKDDLTGDVSQGWTGYPDFADRFTALWANAR